MQETKRFVNEGAEKWLGQKIECLDHGFVYLVDYMGGDDSIVQAARVSYGKGTKKVSEDAALIRYLLRHKHTTPIEMVEFKFHSKHPIFVARQWIRHRTANVNEYSGRYSEMPNEFYLPGKDQLRSQSTSNNQGRGDELDPETREFILTKLQGLYRDQMGSYNEFLEKDFAKELARIGLSVANYTEWYWKIDLHNLFHFLQLRLDPHAQWEIRVYAEAMAKIVKDSVPVAYRAFEEYRLNAIGLNEMEIKFIQQCYQEFPVSEERARELIGQYRFLTNKRETSEFVEKLKKLNFLI